ncbi:MAG: protocatechuate 3,4-dioxygenase subunit alpha [Herminiimonas sp.]|jgi:protocatechuate 3,4-dioxygenase alpha subunit|nr:protocatechuate 3,4-dioxygenase subunit alpha [Herminiimonas sp.]
MSLQQTSSQTIGPYLHIGTDWMNTPNLAGEQASGERIVIEGRLFDGNANPITDGLIEIWQANAHGKYAHPEDTRDLPLETGFRGFGRVPTDAYGFFRFTTVKPGRVPGPDGKLQAPHISVAIFARGLLKQLTTRLYFPDGEGNADDPVLSMVPAERRATLVARAVAARPGVLEWNIAIQGDAGGQGETVFFSI